MKGVRGLLTIACLLLAAPAAAGTLYRCDGADGARSYVSKRVAGAKCVVVARSSPATRRAAPATPKAAAPATPAGGASSKEAPAVAPPSPARKPTRLVQGQVFHYFKDSWRHSPITRST